MTVRPTKHFLLYKLLTPPFPRSLDAASLHGILIYRKFGDAHKNGAFVALKCRMVLTLTGHVQKDISIDCE